MGSVRLIVHAQNQSERPRPDNGRSQVASRRSKEADVHNAAGIGEIVRKGIDPEVSEFEAGVHIHLAEVTEFALTGRRMPSANVRFGSKADTPLMSAMGGKLTLVVRLADQPALL